MWQNWRNGSQWGGQHRVFYTFISKSPAFIVSKLSCLNYYASLSVLRSQLWRALIRVVCSRSGRARKMATTQLCSPAAGWGPGGTGEVGLWEGWVDDEWEGDVKESSTGLSKFQIRPFPSHSFPQEFIKCSFTLFKLFSRSYPPPVIREKKLFTLFTDLNEYVSTRLWENPAWI